MHRWKKAVKPCGVDGWLERLVFIDPERVAVVSLPGARRESVEVYCETSGEAEALRARFGGTAEEVVQESWQPGPATPPGKPLSIAAGRLLVTSRPEEIEEVRAAHPGTEVLCIPAAMAFGTGEHATTGMCLRLIVDASRRLNRAGTPWNVLDLGTGSGILALAASRFGAAHALGLDNDRHAVRTAKENAALNGSTRGVKFQQADLLRRWQPEPGRPWAVVAANLFSNLLVELMPLMTRALAPGGLLITSGILATQADDVANAASGEGLEVRTRRRKGKWVAMLAGKAV